MKPTDPICIYIKNDDAKTLMAKLFDKQLWFKCFFPGGLRKDGRCMMWVRADTDLAGLDYEQENPEIAKAMYPR